LSLSNTNNLNKLVKGNLQIYSQLLISVQDINALTHSYVWYAKEKFKGLNIYLSNPSKMRAYFSGVEKSNHDLVLELLWTVFPAMILVAIGSPSLSVLYGLDEMVSPELTVKAIGQQWFWKYEYGIALIDNNFQDGDNVKLYDISYESHMINEEDLQKGDLRLLEVDFWMLLPLNTQLRLLVTGEDVIHSFAVPSLGVKVDGVPGRMNEVPLFIKRKGVFYGQCSELCGVNHGFMPIVVQSVSRSYFIKLLELLYNINDNVNLEAV